ncbi:hypothetical protein BKA69DRAFT_1055331 [Paraphysoderma sedebokerense]|nr:hypothetical protein BKA69DRAFT_1055331 [Paraphysoderma sedebokerense]
MIAEHKGFFDLTFNELNVEDIKTVNVPALPAGPTQENLVSSIIPSLSVSSLQANLENLCVKFPTRYYSSESGTKSAQWIFDYATSLANNKTTAATVTVEKFIHKDWPQFSIVARIEGKGANKDELVVLGAHQDSIVQSGGSRNAPGCDDDGSGSTTILEAYKALVNSEFVPSRTIEFQWFAAEERGLWGSQAIANKYKADGKIVAGMMQLDMTGYVANAADPHISMVRDFVNQDLTNYVVKLFEKYGSLPVRSQKCGYACSDHASYHRAGYPSSFPFEDNKSNPNIHTTRDTMDKISVPHILEFAKGAVAFAVELGSVEK